MGRRVPRSTSPRPRRSGPTGARTRHEYALTERGLALLPAVVALLRWGNDHLPATSTRLELVHAGCGATVRTEVRCGCGHDVALGDLEAVSSTAP